MRAVLALQRLAGNRAVGDLVASSRRQTPASPRDARSRSGAVPLRPIRVSVQRAAAKPVDVTTEETSAEIGPSLGGPFASYAAYASTLVDGTFLGHPIRTNNPPFKAIHPRLQPKLDAAKAEIDAEYAKSGNPIPSLYGIADVLGFRFKQGPHGWGLAIDIDITRNPYVMHESDEPILDAQLAPVYHRIARFILNDPIGSEQSVIPRLITTNAPMRGGPPVSRRDRVAAYYDRLRQESDAIETYFRLMKSPADIPAWLTLKWQPRHPGETPPTAADVERQQWEDYATLGGAVPTAGPAGVTGFHLPGPIDPGADRPFKTNSGGQFDPAGGMLSLPRELVLGLSKTLTRWGAIDFWGASGDVQHFDDMGGIGAEIASATERARRRKTAAMAATSTPSGTPGVQRQAHSVAGTGSAAGGQPSSVFPVDAPEFDAPTPAVDWTPLADHPERISDTDRRWLAQLAANRNHDDFSLLLKGFNWVPYQGHHGWQHFGRSSAFRVPAGGDPLLTQMAEEIMGGGSGEAQPSGVVTYDATVSIGAGWADSSAVRYMREWISRDAAVGQEMLRLGIAFLRNGTFAVVGDDARVLVGNEAHEWLRQLRNGYVLKRIADLAESPEHAPAAMDATLAMLDAHTIAPMRKSGLYAKALTWPPGAFKAAAHMGMWFLAGGPAGNPNDFGATGGDPGKLVHAFVKNLVNHGLVETGANGAWVFGTLDGSNPAVPEHLGRFAGGYLMGAFGATTTPRTHDQALHDADLAGLLLIPTGTYAKDGKPLTFYNLGPHA